MNNKPLLLLVPIAIILMWTATIKLLGFLIMVLAVIAAIVGIVWFLAENLK